MEDRGEKGRQELAAHGQSGAGDVVDVGLDKRPKGGAASKVGLSEVVKKFMDAVPLLHISIPSLSKLIIIKW